MSERRPGGPKKRVRPASPAGAKQNRPSSVSRRPSAASRTRKTPAAPPEVPESKTWGFTRRTAILSALIVLALVAVTPYLKSYFDQQQEISELEAEVADQKRDVEDLETQIRRWEDPAFVAAQARGRLLYVMPGETRYRVTDAEGNIAAEPKDVADEVSGRNPDDPWFSTLWGSLEGADTAP